MNRLKMGLLCGAAAALLASQVLAQDAVAFDIAAQDAGPALNEFSRQSGLRLLFPYDAVEGKRTPAINGELSSGEALNRLLAATGLVLVSNDGQTVTLAQPEGGSGPQSASAGGDVDALIVTAQKREENIQDVPIAISAFSQQALDEQKIEGGFDLLKAIPNVTFSKNNFTGYNFQIRGIGTKAVSASTDPAVAVSFNNTGLLRNRLFEQEYFDVERVEVLRGPQGTLYGRNATGGVVNVISRLPTDIFEGEVDAEVGNYNSRRARAMINVPLGDTFAVRLAGSATQRDGYGWNEKTETDVDGRNLWSTRFSAAWEPTERFRANLVWEHFSEDDQRARTSKQLCHRDPGPAAIGAVDNLHDYTRAFMSQGCVAGSLYEDAAFGTPNGLSIPFMLFGTDPSVGAIGYRGPTVLPDGGQNMDSILNPVTYIAPVDPYGNMMQSRDLRTISSLKDPRYLAEADVVQLNFDFDITDELTFSSQTLYNKDKVYSEQDYNRFNSLPVFNDSSGLEEYPDYVCDIDGCRYVSARPSRNVGLTPGGFFNDPQLGPSNTIVGYDISRGDSEQFSQEFRVASSFSGPLNFSAGVNYTKFDVVDEYYVFYNLITITAQAYFNLGDRTCAAWEAAGMPSWCVYIDPSPLSSIDTEGHNYFRSSNPYRLRSWAGFGEVYWEATDTVKITAGLRYTDDQKTFTPVPSQALLAPGLAGGKVGRGYPALPDIEQQWGEWTGRLGIDWKPDLGFTDDTMVYAFYSRGYKGGGANPPGIGYTDEKQSDGSYIFPPPSAPPTFEPEFVNAFEIGAKNTLLDGSLVLNMAAFYYDYKGYQVSKIVDRSSFNENFDAKIWGVEVETVWRPAINLRFNANLGYQNSEIADGAQSIDVMDRTQGNEDWVLVKPWVQLTSNCVVPRDVVEELLQGNRDGGGTGGPGNGEHNGLIQLCPGGLFPSAIDRSSWPNDGAGFYADLGGNELPNTPHWTASLGAQYGWEFGDGWRGTLRGDYYWQSQSFARVYNTQFDKLRAWDNANLRVTLERPDDGLQLEAYIKNAFDNDPITDAFLNSDDTALTTNVFVLDPRLIGLSIHKTF